METLIAILPFALLFLLCPLMMLFMHRGHQHDVADREQPPQPAGDATPSAPAGDRRSS